MPIKTRLLFVLSAVVLVVVAAAPNYHRTRPCVRCSIPNRDYIYQTFSQPKRSLSSTPIMITAPQTAGTSSATTFPTSNSVLRKAESRYGEQHERIKSFQFVQDPILRIDHCSISEMSVLLHESGKWTISMRADQNPVNAAQPLNVTTSEPNQRFTDHLRRNKFQVVARCFVQYGPDRDNALLGKPMVIPLHIKPFWVHRQEPHTVFETQYHPEVRQYFESIDRVEIEFAYELD